MSCLLFFIDCPNSSINYRFVIIKENIKQSQHEDQSCRVITGRNNIFFFKVQLSHLFLIYTTQNLTYAAMCSELQGSNTRLIVGH